MKKIIGLIATLFCISSAQTDGARYLIITHDNFYDDVLPLAEWKNKKGMKTRIARLSEIGGSAAQIRSYILNAYNTWQVRPEFLLLVGAPNYLPFPTVNGWNSDNYYTNMDADLYNEILSGRLTVHNPTEMQTVVNKILAYERTPEMTDSLWFKRAAVIVNVDNDPYDDSIYWSDARHAAGLMVINGYVDIDTLSDIYGHNATTVINSVNTGLGFLQYRGSGVNNWYTPFACNPDASNNGRKLPIVLSITCCTIGLGSTAAGAERWFLTGSPATPRGASGYFATTTVLSGGAYLRSATCKGFWDAVFVDRKRTFGEACEGGRLRVYSMYPGNGADEYVGFTTIGDPEMRLWTATPCSILVTHPEYAPLGEATITINVRKTSDLSPLNNAFVCLTADQDTAVYAVDTTDAGGYANLTISSAILEDTVFVTVTGTNLIPYEGHITVRPTNTPYIIYQKSAVDDSLAGNNNGLINPGESINLPLWVENFSDSTGINVIGILRTADPYTSILDSVKQFGDVIGHDSAYTGDNGYDFMVNYDCPDGHTFTLDLICHDANDSVWISHFNESAFIADLIYQQVQISGGNGNSSFEIGETVFVTVKLKNNGSSPVDNITAVLHSLSPDIGIIDSTGSYLHIGPDSTGINTPDPFIVYAAPSTPQGTIVNFEMIISAPFYLDTVYFPCIVRNLDYFIWNPDPTPTPGQHMNLILSSRGYLGSIGTSLPNNLQYYNAVFVCTGVFPNNYVIPANSAEAMRLVDFTSNGGRLYLEGGDVWFCDPLKNGGHSFDTLFGLHATADGGSNMGPVAGITGTFTNGMLFSYNGENCSMDHISPFYPGSFLIFRDIDDTFECGVAYNSGTYRTVGTSFELGLLVDGDVLSTRSVLLDSIMHFFRRGYAVEETTNPLQASKIAFFEVYPNPFLKNLSIKFQIPNYNPPNSTAGQTNSNNQVPNDMRQASLKIFDSSGRLIKSFELAALYPQRTTSVHWSGTDDYGHELPSGIYFVQQNTGYNKFTIKTIKLK